MSERVLTAVAASEIKPVLTKWLWKGYLALGSLSVLAGRQGLGKSTLAIRLAAYVSRGKLPGHLRGRPAGVLYATAEDDLAATLVPRLMAAGADLTRVFFLKADTDGNPVSVQLPQDIRVLAELAREKKVRLLVIDPLVPFLGGRIDAHRDQDVRTALAPLVQVAEEVGFTVLVVMHLNKATATVDALTRISGSVAFTAAPRSVLVFASDPSDPEGHKQARVLAHAKSNLGKLQRSRSCTIVARTVATDDGPSVQPVVEIGGPVDHSATDLVGAAGQSVDERSERGEARAFLLSELASGPVAAKEILERATELGIAKRTLERAKKDAGAESKQGANGWIWELKERADQ